MRCFQTKRMSSSVIIKVLFTLKFQQNMFWDFNYYKHLRCIKKSIKQKLLSAIMSNILEGCDSYIQGHDGLKNILKWASWALVSFYQWEIWARNFSYICDIVSSFICYYINIYVLPVMNILFRKLIHLCKTPLTTKILFYETKIQDGYTYHILEEGCFVAKF